MLYDIIVEVGHTIARNGLSLSALATAVFVLLKQRSVKKRLRRFLPWLFDDECGAKEYITNQRRIEAKIDAVARHLGVELWDAENSFLNRNLEKHSSISLRTDGSSATFAKSRTARMGIFHLGRMKNMKKKLLSRKFILAVVSAVLIVLNDGLDLGIDQDTVLAFAGIVVTYIVGEAAVDVSKKAQGFDETKTH